MEDNVKTVDLSPSYIFCASSEPDFSRLKSDRIFKITDLELFGNLLSAEYPSFLKKVMVGPVEYTAQEGDPFIDGPKNPHPLRKSAEMKWEKEIRIVWERGPIYEPFLDLSCLKIAALIEEVYE